MNKSYDIIIVGAGPSGMMAAITAKSKNKNYKVCVLESTNSVGKKLSITGGGRCNFTNNIDISDFFEHIVRNKKFLYSSFYAFSNYDLMDFVKNLGHNYKIEYDTGKVYLDGSNAKNLSESLYKKMNDLCIDIITNSKLMNFKINNDFYELYTNEKIFYSKKVIFATGGKSYPQLGSDGSIFNILRKHDILIEPLVQGLSPVIVEESWYKSIPGVSIKDVEIYVEISKNTKRKTKAIRGDMIFTHKGIGGPAVLKVSSVINRNIENYCIKIDFLPDISNDKLKKIISENPKKNLLNIFKMYLPVRFLKIVLELCNNSEDINFDFIYDNVSNISNKNMDLFISNVKSCKLTPKSLEPIDIATVTSGGVSVSEINASTMESTRYKGLYFVGEMIDVDAFTGGFNLQIAFSTGYLAGISID